MSDPPVCLAGPKQKAFRPNLRLLDVTARKARMTVMKQLANLMPSFIRDPLVNVWREFRGNPELHVLRILAVPSKLALDVGANAGTYARQLARHAKGCIAFEPVPELAKSIEKKYGRFGVVVHPCALSDRTGNITLRIPISNGVENPQNASVEPDDLSIGTIIRVVEVPRT
jgi:hypothetical protein